MIIRLHDTASDNNVNNYLFPYIIQYVYSDIIHVYMYSQICLYMCIYCKAESSITFTTAYWFFIPTSSQLSEGHTTSIGFHMCMALAVFKSRITFKQFPQISR